MASHPKTAQLRPRLEYEKADAALADSRAELMAATADLRRKQLIEGGALASWITISPSPSQDDIFRDKIAKENAARLERVAKGLPPEEPKASKVGGSPLDQAYANRGKGPDVNRRTGRPAVRPVAPR